MSGPAHTVIGMDASPAQPLPLFQVPEWTRVVGVFDLETTGVDAVSYTHLTLPTILLV